MWYVYSLQSLKDYELYTGMSENPHRRLADHNAGMTKSTKSRRPFVLIYQEVCKSSADARRRERWLKSGCGREFLKKYKMS